MNTSDAREQRANEEIDEQLEYERQKNDKEFIEQVYEIAFGDNAINRNFSHEEVIDALKEINEDSVKWLDREICPCKNNKTGNTMPW